MFLNRIVRGVERTKQFIGYRCQIISRKTVSQIKITNRRIGVAMLVAQVLISPLSSTQLAFASGSDDVQPPSQHLANVDIDLNLKLEISEIKPVSVGKSRVDERAEEEMRIALQQKLEAEQKAAAEKIAREAKRSEQLKIESAK